MEIIQNKVLESDCMEWVRKRIASGYCPEIKAQPQMVYQRTGWHASDLIYCGVKTMFRKRGHEYPPDNVTLWKFALGHAYEDWFKSGSQQTSDVFELDGIKLTPDLINFTPSEILIPLGEMKLTWSSINKFNPREYQHYIVQMANYCMVTENDQCKLIVLFLNGGYRPPRPQLKVWTVSFTYEELAENWSEMLRRKRLLEDALKGDGFPDETWKAFSKECDWCEFINDCPLKGSES